MICAQASVIRSNCVTLAAPARAYHEQRPLLMRSLICLLLLSGTLAAQGPIQKRERPVPRATSQAPERFYDAFLVSMEGHQLEIETVSRRRVVCSLTRETRWTTPQGDFIPGDRIGVTSASRDEGQCIASWVGRPGERYQERRDLPALSRTGSGRIEKATEPAPIHDDPLILKAFSVNGAFSEAIPDYSCHQKTIRSDSYNLGKKWKERDAVEADVVVYRGLEHYDNITIDGSPTSAPMDQIGGTWSTGEFSSMLYNLFLPASETSFKALGKEESIRGRSAWIYDLHVRQDRSHWTLHIGNVEYNPEYRGQVWIDAESGRALRIEIEAINLPWEYPASMAETTLEFDEYAIGDQPYLLPVEASNLACIRGRARCFKNQVAFDDYRKFTADSSMFDVGSSVDFGDVVAGEAEEDGPAEPEPRP